MTSLLTRTILTDSGCSEWQGVRDTGNYGRLGGRLVHRRLWEEIYGPIPDGMCVCHRCDNPPCIEPSHLFLGTHADNRRDSVAKGREFRKVQRDRHQEIFERLQAGERQATIAAALGVNRNQIRRISAGLGWQFRNSATCQYHGVPKRLTPSGRTYCHICVTQRSRKRRALLLGQAAA